MQGGPLNIDGKTGDFLMSSVATMAIMLNVFHILIYAYTRHFNAIIVSIYIYSAVCMIALLALDNVECFKQTNLFMFLGSWIFNLSILCGTAMICIPMYAIKCWEMAISSPEFYQKDTDN